MRPRRLLQSLALTAAAAASLATSAPPPDWTQEAELPWQTLRVNRNEGVTFSFAIEAPPDGPEASLHVEAPAGASLQALVAREGEVECNPQNARRLPSFRSSSEPSETPGMVRQELRFTRCATDEELDPALDPEDLRCQPCLPRVGEGKPMAGVVHTTITGSKTDGASFDIRVKVVAHDEGYDDDPQEPRLSLELR